MGIEGKIFIRKGSKELKRILLGNDEPKELLETPKRKEVEKGEIKSNEIKNESSAIKAEEIADLSEYTKDDFDYVLNKIGTKFAEIKGKLEGKKNYEEWGIKNDAFGRIKTNEDLINHMINESVKDVSRNEKMKKLINFISKKIVSANFASKMDSPGDISKSSNAIKGFLDHFNKIQTDLNINFEKTLADLKFEKAEKIVKQTPEIAIEKNIEGIIKPKKIEQKEKSIEEDILDLAKDVSFNLVFKTKLSEEEKKELKELNKRIDNSSLVTKLNNTQILRDLKNKILEFGKIDVKNTFFHNYLKKILGDIKISEHKKAEHKPVSRETGLPKNSEEIISDLEKQLFQESLKFKPKENKSESLPEELDNLMEIFSADEKSKITTKPLDIKEKFAELHDLIKKSKYIPENLKKDFNNDLEKYFGKTDQAMSLGKFLKESVLELKSKYIAHERNGAMKYVLGRLSEMKIDDDKKIPIVYKSKELLNIILSNKILNTDINSFKKIIDDLGIKKEKIKNIAEGEIWESDELLAQKVMNLIYESKTTEESYKVDEKTKEEIRKSLFEEQNVGEKLAEIEKEEDLENWDTTIDKVTLRRLSAIRNIYESNSLQENLGILLDQKDIIKRIDGDEKKFREQIVEILKYVIKEQLAKTPVNKRKGELNNFENDLISLENDQHGTDILFKFPDVHNMYALLDKDWPDDYSEYIQSKIDNYYQIEDTEKKREILRDLKNIVENKMTYSTEIAKLKIGALKQIIKEEK